ncbi:hypothetical protein D7316_02865 [Gordonia insulae]|uniref:Uncharacterized protein n=1 Tax=Gordonia insulae TaxID=2420509 RepID=A0A3G8JMG1_9ACTN|nr:hypothetical protein D7316_02865 [Gordonia insulae]
MTVTVSNGRSGETYTAGPHDEHPRLSRAVRASLLLAALIASFVTAGSYGHALGAPGPGDAEDRTAAWAHRQHVDPVVSLLESWVTARHHPDDS